jgi:hypothetical protein
VPAKKFRTFEEAGRDRMKRASEKEICETLGS